MGNNKMSFMSRIIQELHHENAPYKNTIFQTSAESFEIAPQNVVLFFVECGINKSFLVV